MLDVVLRTCDHTAVHPERGERFIVCDKTTLIKKCFISLIDSIELAKNICDIKLWVLDDHSSDELIEYMDKKCTEKNIDSKIIFLEESGFNYSALRQFEYCRTIGRKWVYSVEDDYLHFPEAISNMLIMGQKFKEITNTTVALKPDDDPFSYASNYISSRKPCRVFLGNDRHWRSCSNTHNTVFTDVQVFKDYWEIFASLAKFYKKIVIDEDATINRLWTDGVMSEGPVPLFSPIPSLAFHVSQGNAPHFVDYNKLWNSISI
jgi:glycosyltransferase involved in cell wall biosynthesis